MKAMILAAGFGTRLKKLTEHTPKPLVNITKSKKIIDNIVELLIKTGISEIAVNLHYKGDNIKEYLQMKYPKVKWRFFFEKKILGTGGGLYNARNFLADSENFILINSDILFYFDLKKHIRSHKKKRNMVTLIVFENRNDKRAVCYSKGKLIEFTPCRKGKTGTFTGIHILNKKIFNHMESYLESNPEQKFSIISIYKEIIKKREKIGIIENKAYWKDLGTLKSLREGRKEYAVFKFIENNFNENIKTIEKTFQGGSGKKIYRVNTDKTSRIIIFSKQEEIKSIKAISRFFEDKKFPIPHIIKSSKDWVIMEDGGKISLLDMVNKYKKKGKFPFEYYEKAIDYLEELFKTDIGNFPLNSLYQTGYFDFKNIRFDIKYFNRYYYNTIHSKTLSDKEIDKLAEVIYSDLKKLPLSIIHRDYQSSNILIDSNNEIHIIDFQTMRLGAIIYDLASLVFDSYIPFNKEIISRLIDYFYNLESFKNFSKQAFWAAAFIRVLQNLGAFGNLGRNNKFFSSKIKEAEKRLRYVLKNFPFKTSISGILEQLKDICREHSS